jgi:hypothetical protein
LISGADITIKAAARVSLNVERSMGDTSEIFERAIKEHIGVIHALPSQRPVLERIAAEMCRTILNGRKILWRGKRHILCGHMLCGFVERFVCQEQLAEAEKVAR